MKPEQLAADNDWIVAAALRKLRHPSWADVDALEAAGRWGLLEAAKRFDPTVGVKFKTYAFFRVRGAMKDWQRDEDHLSRRRRTRVKQLKALQQEAPRALEAELAVALGVPPHAVASLRRDAEPRVALDAVPRGTPTGECIGDLIPDPRPSPAVIAERRDLVECMLSRLRPRERRLIAGRYLEGKTQRELAGEFGVSESRVCKLEQRAMDWLRTIARA